MMAETPTTTNKKHRVDLALFLFFVLVLLVEIGMCVSPWPPFHLLTNDGPTCYGLSQGRYP